MRVMHALVLRNARGEILDILDIDTGDARDLPWLRQHMHRIGGHSAEIVTTTERPAQ